LFEASGRAVGRQEWALLTEDVTFKPELTCFLPVRLQSDIDGVQRARPVPTNTSGDFAALAGTDGYIELARDLPHFPQGTPVPVHRWAAR
jgi:molybdopterin molybdotransferase